VHSPGYGPRRGVAWCKAPYCSERTFRLLFFQRPFFMDLGGSFGTLLSQSLVKNTCYTACKRLLMQPLRTTERRLIPELAEWLWLQVSLAMWRRLVRRPGIKTQRSFKLRHVRLSVRIYQRGSHWTNFCEIWNWRLLWKVCWENKIWLKSAKNVAHFTWRFKNVLLFPVTLHSHKGALQVE
jgi:hypothetical protein